MENTEEEILEESSLDEREEIVEESEEIIEEETEPEDEESEESYVEVPTEEEHLFSCLVPMPTYISSIR